MLQLEAEGIACGPRDDWQTMTISRSGEMRWEAPPSTYRAELIFRNLLDGSVDDAARAGNYTIAEISVADGVVSLRAEPEFRVTLRVSLIDVVARDQE